MASSSVILVTNQQSMPMPCTSTIATMIAEIKVISMCRTVDAMCNYVNITQVPQLLRLTILMKFMSALIQEVICCTTKPSLDFDNEGYEDCNC